MIAKLTTLESPRLRLRRLREGAIDRLGIIAESFVSGIAVHPHLRRG